MRQRRRWPRDEGERLSMTPMIDVTFLLLLFFLCTLQIKTLEGKIPAMLPKDAGRGGQPSVVEDVLITLRVDSTETERAVRFNMIGREYADLEALRDRLRRIPRAQTPAIRLRCREGILYGDVVSLLDMLLLDDWTDIRFVAQK
jgi:biopolymer transport protein ExbD